MPKRSPVIFWLLLAATLCVDAVVVAWVFESYWHPPAKTAFVAMAYPQVSILCTWAVLCGSKIKRRWLIPSGAGFLVALLTALAEEHSRHRPHIGWDQLLTFTSLMCGHVATLILLLWLLKPFRLFGNNLGSTSHRSWRFTTKHMLLLMTCLPILIIVFKKSAFVRSGVTLHGFVEFVAWVVGNVVLPLAIAAIVQRKWMWVLRMAASAGAGLVIGLFLQWAVPELSRVFHTVAFALIQAFVAWVWLENLPLRCEADIIPTDARQPMQEVQ